jgi:hypothetical protein
LAQNSLFNGFGLNDFGYFKKTEVKDHIALKRKLKSFASLIWENLDDSIKSIYDGLYFSSYKKNKSSAWFIISRKKEDRSVFKNCKFKIGIDKDCLSLSSIVQDGSHWDKKPIGILYDKIVSDPEGFFRLMDSFNKEYTLNIYKRMPAGGDKLAPGNEKLLPVYSIDLAAVTEEIIQEFLLFLEETKLPLVSLETMLFKNNKILNEPANLIAYTVKNIQKQNAFFTYAEGR